MPWDLLIRGGTLVTGAGASLGDLAVAGGRIGALLEPGTPAQAARVVDATDLLVLPGGIDVHNHPVHEDKWTAVSSSGALGGITTLISFVGALEAWGFPRTNPMAIVKLAIEAGQRESLLDFGLHLALPSGRDDRSEIPAAVEAGVVSFKFFLAYKRRGMMVSDEEMVAAMDAIAQAGGMAMVHCENGSAIDYLEQKFLAESSSSSVSPDLFLRAHTDLLEAEAVYRAIALAESVGCPLYIPHLAAKEAAEVVARFKDELAIPLYGETCPQYLLLTNEELLKQGPPAKVGPPLREVHDQEALWRGLRIGTIDVVGSDHAGYTLATKRAARHIFEARYGCPGIGTMLPLLYSEGVSKGRLSLPRLIQLLAENPARIFGLWPRKGNLLPGADADLVLFDPARRHTIRAKMQGTTSDYSLFEGWECLGAPRLVMQRGRILVEEGEVKAGPGEARFLPGRRRETA